MDGSMDGSMDGWINGWMDESMDGSIDGSMNEWMNDRQSWMVGETEKIKGQTLNNKTPQIYIHVLERFPTAQEWYVSDHVLMSYLYYCPKHKGTGKITLQNT